ncbi:hypothetical protein FZC76_17890 [Sutcliffiella horikoshii]|uniref:Uncharacterized protein n=1 Tax=Sutcliffiella horikoshii TaxID=79883 RepID=A0A5D4SQZ3_9BACI|nr:hypothetical protein [Sutcliffiella horikoshii]TYS65755.1 hypothetical protein FZC76_17890 [Sutcliffiella horikoshii]
MSEFDFGDEHLKFLFERWKVDEGITEAGKQAKINISTADEGFMYVQQLEAKMNKYIGNLERWMEGKASTVDVDFEDEEE